MQKPCMSKVRDSMHLTYVPTGGNHHLNQDNEHIYPSLPHISLCAFGVPPSLPSSENWKKPGCPMLGNRNLRIPHYEILHQRLKGGEDTIQINLEYMMRSEINQSQKDRYWVSLVAQWLRVCLPMQGTRVRALVWEDPTCRGATRPVSHNY